MCSFMHVLHVSLKPLCPCSFSIWPFTSSEERHYCFLHLVGLKTLSPQLKRQMRGGIPKAKIKYPLPTKAFYQVSPKVVATLEIVAISVRYAIEWVVLTQRSYAFLAPIQDLTHSLQIMEFSFPEKNGVYVLHVAHLAELALKYTSL